MGNCVYNIYNAYITPMWGCTGMIRSRFHSVAHNLSLIARPSASRCGQRCHWDGRKSSWENSFLAEKKADTFRLEEDFGTFPSLFFFVGSRFFFWGVGGGEKGRFWRETYFTIWLVIFFGQFSVKKPTWAIYTFWPKGFGKSDRPNPAVLGENHSGRWNKSCRRNRKMPLALKKPTESSAQFSVDGSNLLIDILNMCGLWCHTRFFFQREMDSKKNGAKILEMVNYYERVYPDIFDPLRNQCVCA